MAPMALIRYTVPNIMKFHASFRATSLALSTALVAFTPFAAGAASLTNQQVLNNALSNVFASGAVATIGSLNVETKVKPRSGDTSTVNMGLNVSNRLQPTQGEVRQEMRVSLNSLNIQGFSIGTGPNGGATVETRLVGKNMYMRIINLSDAAVQTLQSTGMNTDELMGEWIVFPAAAIPAMGGALPLLPQLQGAGQPLSAIPDVVKIAGMPKAVTLKKIEKTWKDESGQEFFRARVGLSTASVTASQKSETATVSAKDPKRAAKIAAINQRYTSLRTLLSNTEFVTEVNKTNGTLTRFELGGALSQPTKVCTPSGKTQTCKTTGSLQVRFNGGLNLNKDVGPLIASPGTPHLTIASQ